MSITTDPSFYDQQLEREADKMVQDLGIAREAAKTFLLLVQNALVQHPGSDAAAGLEVQRGLAAAHAEGASWPGEYMAATYRRHLPRWRRVHRRAQEAGIDPAAALAHRFNLTAQQAEAYLALIKRTEEGASVENIVTTELAGMHKAFCP